MIPRDFDFETEDEYKKFLPKEDRPIEDEEDLDDTQDEE